MLVYVLKELFIFRFFFCISMVFDSTSLISSLVFVLATASFCSCFYHC